MNELLLYIDDFLNKESKIINFNRDHIFFNILQIIKQQVSDEDRIIIISIFSDIEKTLHSLRTDSLDVSEAKLKLTKKKYMSLSYELKRYLSISFYPMSSYYYYINQKYEFAITELNLFFENSEKVLCSNHEIKLLANTEQSLNMFRIYFSKNDFINANLIANQLLLKAFRDQSEIKDLDERESWIHYIFNCVLRRYIYNFNTKKELISLIASLANHDIDNNIFYFIKTLNILYLREDNKFLEKAIVTLKGDRDIPNILIYIFLSELNSLMIERSLEEHNYYKRIANKYLEKIINNFNKNYIILLS